MKTSERLSLAELVEPTFLKGFEKIISKDKLKPVMNGVYFDNGKAIATDSHKLVKVDLELYGLKYVGILDGYYMDSEVLSECKAKSDQRVFLEKGKVLFVSNDSFKIIKTLELQLMEEVGKYPNYEAVIPVGSNPVEKIGINGKFLVEVQNLYTLSGAGDGSKLRITFSGENRAIKITDEQGLFTAIIMPILTK